MPRSSLSVRSSRPAVFAIKLSIAAGITYALFHFHFLSLDSLAAIARSPLRLAIALILVFATIPLSAWRWHLLLRARGVPLSLGDVMRVTFIGVAFNNVAPGGAGGDAMRLYYVFRLLPAGRLAATLTLILDRLIALVGLLGLAAFVLTIRPGFVFSHAGLKLLALSLVGAFLALVVLFACAVIVPGLFGFTAWLRQQSRGWGALKHVAEALDGLTPYRSKPGTLVAAFGLSVMVQLLTVGSIIVLADSTGHGALGLADYAFAGPVGLLMNTVPITPGGFGVGEAAFGQLCRLLESTPSAFSYASIFLAYRAVAVLATLPGFAVYLFSYAKHAPETSP